MSRLSTRLKGRQLIWSLVPVALGLVIVQLQTAHRRAYVPLQNVRLPRLYLFPQRVAALAFSPDSHRLAIADAQQQLWFYNLATRQFESHFDHQCQDDAQSLAWHQPDCLVVGDLERTRVFVLPRGTLQRTTPPLQQKRARRYEPDHYYQTVLSPTGNVAARGDVLGLIEVWNAVTGQRYFLLRDPHLITRGLALSANATTLAIGSFVVRNPPGNARWEMAVPVGIEIALRDAHTGQLRRTVRWDAAGIAWAPGLARSELGLAFSPDGKTLAGVATAGLALWDVASGHLLHKTKENSTPRWGGQKWIAFSPTGAFVAALGWDDAIYIWSVKTGKLLQVFHGSPYNDSLAFSPDSKLLATGGQDKRGEGVVKIWDVQALTTL